MATRSVLTNAGREWWARFMANYPAWRDLGTPYEIFSYAKWGEGGWTTVSGSDVPEDPSLYLGNTDITIVANPSNYPGYSYASSGIPIDLTTEVQYIGGGNQHFEVTARLETTEENDNGAAGNPRFYEVGIFDNASAAGVGASDNLIIYCTFDGFLKTNTRAVDVDALIPMQP